MAVLHKLTLIILLCFFVLPTACKPQVRSARDKIDSIAKKEDSLCKFGKKYVRPKRKSIDFPAKHVSVNYKAKELQKAIPDSLKDENNKDYWFYNYYFIDEYTDYDPIGDSVFTPPGNSFLNKLKDTHFFDINGDGLLDFIHYPKYLRVIKADNDFYEMFIQVKDVGYKWITFRGYIFDIKYNNDKTLKEITTFRGPCCDDNHATFYHYTFDKKLNDLILTNQETILTCQLKE